MGTDANPALRAELEEIPTEELYARVRSADARRASELDPMNRRRLIRALEIIASLGYVPPRVLTTSPPGTRLDLVEGAVTPRCTLIHAIAENKVHAGKYEVEWIVIDPPSEELRARINARLEHALARGLIDEVLRVRESLKNHFSSDREISGYEKADARLNELGLEYKIVGEYLRGERDETSLLPTLSAKLWQYARRQKAWMRKLRENRLL